MMDDGFICVFCTAPSLAIFTISPASLSAAAETLSLSLSLSLSTLSLSVLTLDLLVLYSFRQVGLDG